MTSDQVYGRIYGLLDPRDGSLRYVGQTTRSLKKRLQEHLSLASRSKQTHVSHWLKLLWGLGLRPYVQEFDSAFSRAELDVLEVTTICAARVLGICLTNHTDGGGGQKGRKYTDASRAKMSASHKGKPAPHMRRPRSAETRAKLSLAAKGKKISDEARKKLSVSLKGRVFSPAHRAALSLAAAGKPRKKGSRAMTHQAAQEMVLLAQTGKYTAISLARQFGVTPRVVRNELAKAGVWLKAGRPSVGSRLEVSHG